MTAIGRPTIEPAPAPAARVSAPPLLRIVGGVSDVRELLGGEAAGQGEDSYRQFLDALGVAVYVTDAGGRITFFNRAAGELWGRNPELGELWCGSWRLYWTDGRPMRHDECPMAMCLREGREVRGYEAMAERPDGTTVYFEPYPTPLRDADGEMFGAVNVMVDVTARRRAEDRVRATAEQLRVSNAIKDDFLGLVSHELRTPVTTIFGNARLLRDRAGRLSDDERQSMVSDVAGESERLLGIIENLLTLTRIEAGVQLDPEPQVLPHLVRKSIDSYRARHPERTVPLTVEPHYIIVEADRAHLEVIFENLLSNADKYSPAQLPVEVVVRSTDSEAHVIVRDQGIGLDESDADRLFSPFYRSESARARTTGIGLGLTVCRRLAELQGGRMWARRRVGGGSEFGVALPLAPDPGGSA